MRFIVKLLVNALALWLTAAIVGGVHVTPWAPGGARTFLTYLLVALIFGLVNGIVGTAIRIVAFPVYLLTLGLFALIVNGLLLLIVSGISSWIGFGLHVDGFWWGVLGAIVLAIFSWLIGLVVRPVTRGAAR